MATLEVLRALALAAYVPLCAVPVGLATLRLAGAPASLRGAERWVAAAGLGMGVQAYALTLVGLAGMFWPMVVVALPGVLAALALLVETALRGIARRRARESAGSSGPRVPVAVASSSGGWPPRLATATGILMGLLALAVVVSDLAPPTDYDGLLYHLVAPRTYLEHGAIVYIPHNFSANLPAFGEMSFAVGLAGGSDRAPQLTHAGAGALAIAATWLLGRRLLPGGAAAGAAAGLAATPLVPFLATRAYIDLFTMLYATLAMWALVVWLAGGGDWTLLAGGLALGFAVSTKYAALTVGIAVGMTIAFAAWRRGGAAFALRASSRVGAAALVAWLPWLARQVVTLGNPAWPMYLGGRDWDPARVEQLTYFVGQYGGGATPSDWLLLPINVFRESWLFGHVPWSFPPPLAIAAPLALRDTRPVIRALLFVAATTCVLWARGWQDLRFLLTIYPVLAILGVAALHAALPRRWAGPVVALAAGAMLIVTLARESERALDRLPVVLGRESRDAFLSRAVSSHAAVSYLNASVPAGRSVLFLGDGQIWYCRMRCIPDPAHDNLLVFFLGGRPGASIDVEAASQRLRDERVSHVLLSRKDYWYLEHQDPQGRLQRQLAEFYVFKARYLDLVYEDDLTEVYRVRS